jgi:ATP-dependent DNA helicase RecG
MLDESVQYIKGIGPKRAKILSQIGIETVRDILSYYPKAYDDRREISKAGAVVSGENAVLSVKSELSEVIKLNAKLSLFKAALSDGTGMIYGTFFRQSNPYFKHDIFAKLKNDFKKGSKLLVYGQVEQNFGEKQIKIEEYEVIPDNNKNIVSAGFNRIVPLYALSEGINQKWLRDIILEALKKYSHLWPEILPEKIKNSENMQQASEALKHIHFPESFQDAEDARKRLAFDEFLLFQAALQMVKKKTKNRKKARAYDIKKNLLTPFKQKLGFEFAKSQKKVINEIFSDMQEEKPMNRLLLGDVGSGKTVVALSSMLLAVENGYQAALIAPTEILAEQHFITVNEKISGLPVRMALLTSRASGTKKEKQALKKALSEGRIDIAIGTHAMLQKDVSFKNLALAVIDEQHRFGVLQRAGFKQKGQYPDVLVMTATPIPRTLALTVYGDLDISTITELPCGRQPVKTLFLNEDKAYTLVKQEVKNQNQAFIVYPLIEESDKVEAKAAVKETEYLSVTVFKEYKVGLLHGQMPSKEKERVMLDFKNKKFDILISTTVIEVGIDIPNATVMIIEHAERFGLATLHQLRGRIGRGPGKSYCILLGTPRTEESKRRIAIMQSTNNGFKIAEEDLAIRGPGEFFGTSQSGIPPFKAGNILSDVILIEKSKYFAENITKTDALLKNKDLTNLNRELLRMYKGKFGLSRV